MLWSRVVIVQFRLTPGKPYILGMYVCSSLFGWSFVFIYFQLSHMPCGRFIVVIGSPQTGLDQRKGTQDEDLFDYL